MGGIVRVVSIISGEKHIQSRWTNMLPEYVKNWKFMHVDKDYICKYINAKSAYAQKVERFAPIDYGLVLCDFDNKRLYSSQNYTALGIVNKIAIRMYVKGHVIRSEPGTPVDEKTIKPGDEDYFPDEIKRLWDNNYLKLVAAKSIEKGPRPDNYWYFYKKDLNMSFEEVYKMMEDFHESYKQYKANKSANLLKRLFSKEVKFPSINAIEFEIDWAAMGWDYKEFDEEKKEEVQKMFELIQSQYALTKEDVKVWKEFIADMN